LLATAPSPLTDDARVRLHHGTSEVMARVTLLDGLRELPPGNVGFAQLRLEAPLLALPDDRFILRRYSPATTIGGGKVLDAHPPRRRGRWRQTDELLKQLAAGGDQRRTAFIFRAWRVRTDACRAGRPDRRQRCRTGSLCPPHPGVRLSLVRPAVWSHRQPSTSSVRTSL
jgi:selenocysteine-specific translation elongation factor